MYLTFLAVSKMSKTGSFCKDPEEA